jgi:beta-glucosidase
MTRFPQGFLWGAATAGHQVEGGNVNADLWPMEWVENSTFNEPSGDACDHYHRYPEDISTLAELGLNAYRFSLEWSRIEPEDGEWSIAALDHYRRHCARCHELGIAPVVTFNHFTIPRWLAARGGWEWSEAPERFARFCERAGAHLGDLIGWACTLNEPNIVAEMGYLHEVFPPGVRDRERRRVVNEALCRAHVGAVTALRAAPGVFPVGLTLSMTDYQALAGGEERLDRMRHDSEDVFLEACAGDDFVGVQCYTRMRIGPNGVLPPEPGVPVTQMGYEYWPQAVEATVRRAWDVTGGIPVVVTENGISTLVDAERVAFVTEALGAVQRCLADGIDVRGYFYWSLMDNFEWVLGYGPRFGLVEVDPATFERRPKPSAAWFGSVSRANGLP